jgi:membrane fusion protein (multidrug efflux system)
MADSRTIITSASLVVALACAAWAIYASKHVPVPGVGGAGPGGFAARSGGAPGGGAPGGRPGGTPGSGPVVAVVTAEATVAPIQVGIEAIGTANANEAVSITSKTSNIVTAIHFSDGQQVKAGQVLLELDRAQSSADLAAATADYNDSVSQFNRSRELLATQALSKAQYEQLEATMKANEARVAAARSRVDDTYIRAPFTGHVGLRRVSLGSLISPGTVITTLDDTRTIKVDFSVPDVYVGQVREGQKIAARTTAYTGRSFRGEVVSIDSRIDPSTRSVTVRGHVPNLDAALKPGMFLTVELAKERRDALLVPEEALVPEQAKQFVYVVTAGKVAKREIQIGVREPGRVEVTQGLAAGEHVVIEGTLKLRDGVAVREQQAAPVVAPAGPPAAGAPPS